MSACNRFLITQSLLSAWQYVFQSAEGYADFLDALHRRKKPQSRAMLEGIRFENVIHGVCDGAEIGPEHEWYGPVTQIAGIVKGGQYQVRLSRALIVHNMEFVAYGVFDFLKAGIIYDTKYSKTYRVGKYLESPQHSMYFYLCPQARRFEYLISDGKWVYTEQYEPQDTPPIEAIASRFMDWLDYHNLVASYCENWKSKF